MIRLIVTGFLCLVLFSAQSQPAIGDKVPDIELKDVYGNIQKLSELKGKLVLVDFWASWCAPCRKANRELAPIYEQYKTKGFEIFSVSLDEQAEDWKKAIAEDKIHWKQVLSAGGWEGPVALQWKIENLPTSFLIDKEGKVLVVDPKKEQILKHLQNLK